MTAASVHGVRGDPGADPGAGGVRPGETVVVKCGGTITERPERMAEDVARARAAGARVVVVHGGSSDIDRLCTALGVERRRIRGPGGVSGRYTDAATLEVVVLALAGVVKTRLVVSLMAAGVPAVGMTGADRGIVRASRRRPFRAEVDGRTTVVRDDHSGHITSVAAAPLRALLDQGDVPVVSPPGLAGDDDVVVNIDADRVAVAVAAALGADRLVLLSGVEGVRADADDPASVLERCVVPAEGPPPQTGGGMGAKLTAARDALRHGIDVRIADGRTERPVTAALAGAGTRVVLAEPGPAEPSEDRGPI